MAWEEDPFESIVREFFGESPKGRRRHETFTEGEEEDRVIDFIETKDQVYIIFELPGYTVKDMVVVVKDRKIEVLAQKKSLGKIQSYLVPKLQQDIKVQKTLPSNINTKKYEQTYKNGVLEIKFAKKDND